MVIVRRRRKLRTSIKFSVTKLALINLLGFAAGKKACFPVFSLAASFAKFFMSTNFNFGGPPHNFPRHKSIGDL